MPVRGFGAKNVVFCGIRTPASAAARIWSTVTGAQQDRGVGGALVDVRRGRRGVVAVGHVGVTRARGARRRRSGRRRRRGSTRGARVEAAAELGARHEQREAVGVDEAERAVRGHRRARARPRFGHVGAGGPDVEARGEAVAQRARASTPVTSRWIGCTQSSSGASSTTSAMIDVGARVVDVVGVALGGVGRRRSRSGGGRRRARAPRPRPRRAIGVDPLRVVEPEQLVDARRRRRARSRAARRRWSSRSRRGPSRARGPRSGRGWRASRAAAPAGRSWPSAACARAGGSRCRGRSSASAPITPVVCARATGRRR